MTDGLVIAVGALVIGGATLVGAAVVGRALDDMEAQSGYVPLYQVQVGQCFDYDPAPMDDDIIPDVRVVDCAEPHDAELIGRFAWQAPAGEDDQSSLAYPGLDVLAAYAAPGCEQAFREYVGIDYRDSELFLSHGIPLRSSWLDRAHGRNFECIVSSWTGGSKLTGSARDSRR
jgi:hypothetical protein